MLKVKIYGERNSNTNYLDKLMRLNFNVDLLPGTVPKAIYNIQRLVPGDEMIRDYYFKKTNHKNGGWKHSFPIPPEDNSQLLICTLSKNPYSWLLSLYKKPYHQPNQNYGSFHNFLKTPWHLLKRENHDSKQLVSPIELWNLKNASYLALNKTHNTINLTAEELLASPKDIFDKLAAQYDLQYLGQHFKNFLRAAKKDADKDNAYYQDYYLNEKWRSELTSEDIALINEGLDSDVLTKFGYEMIEPDSMLAEKNAN